MARLGSFHDLASTGESNLDSVLVLVVVGRLEEGFLMSIFVGDFERELMVVLEGVWGDSVELPEIKDNQGLGRVLVLLSPPSPPPPPLPPPPLPPSPLVSLIKELVGEVGSSV